MQKSIIIFGHIYIHSLACVIDRKNVRIFVPLPFAQETSFFSAFLHGFNSESKNYSVVCGVICDVTTVTTLGSPLTGR